ncbi:unnamed protein product [Wuchereria bancrofti]|uniref:Uncharacterized protein n=1 Tax=Wuchereria bancrofti TaxID=6293 RepID=A0A3P7EKM3_WUCBA|nr:unnamed protein product [Wuchereria bancrofti]
MQHPTLPSYKFSMHMSLKALGIYFITSNPRKMTQQTSPHKHPPQLHLRYITPWGQPVQRTFRRTLCHYGKIRIIIPTLRTTKDH